MTEELVPTVKPTVTLADLSPDFQEMVAAAQAVANSRMFAGIDTKEKALTLMMLARSEGLNYMQAFRRYDIIQGRPAMKSATLFATFQNKGGVVKWIEQSATRCAGEFSAPGIAEPVLVEFTLKDAQAAGLAGKDVWKHYASDMLFARCVTRGVRRTMAGIAEGVITTEEALDLKPEKEEVPRESADLSKIGETIRAVTTTPAVEHQPAEPLVEGKAAEKVAKSAKRNGKKAAPNAAPAPTPAPKIPKMSAEFLDDFWSTACDQLNVPTQDEAITVLHARIDRMVNAKLLHAGITTWEDLTDDDAIAVLAWKDGK